MNRFIVLLLLTLTTGLSFGQNQTYAPPGRMVDIGGRRLHILSSGKGSPAVVLVAGGGALAIDWTLVQSRIDSNTRVCSYDHAGYGWSDNGPAEETVEEEVSDLHKLLKLSGEKAPYILVGASIGGIYIQAYQHKYPNEVAGLIFTNSSNHIGFAAKTRSELIWDFTEDEIRSSYPLPTPVKKHKLATKAIEPFDRLPQPQQDMRVWLTNRMMAKWDTTPPTAGSTLSWRKEFLREFNESDAMKGRFPLGKLPVIVMSSAPKASDSLRYSRDGAASRLDFLSSNTLHIVAFGDGHEVHLYEPDELIRAIRREITAVRKHTALADVAP